MKGGLSPIILNPFIPFRLVSTTDQRPPSPESDHHLTYQGGYR